MGDTVCRIQSISSVEASDDLADAIRTVDRQGCLCATGCPVLQHHFAKPINVIGMEMGQEHRLDIGPGQTQLSESSA
jgi:hypothetical protein